MSVREYTPNAYLIVTTVLENQAACSALSGLAVTRRRAEASTSVRRRLGRGKCSDLDEGDGTDEKGAPASMPEHRSKTSAASTRAAGSVPWASVRGGAVAAGLPSYPPRRPRLMLRLTLAPRASFVPGFGFCAMTLPFFILDLAVVTLPVLQ